MSRMSERMGARDEWDFNEKDGNLGKFDGGSKRPCRSLKPALT